MHDRYLIELEKKHVFYSIYGFTIFSLDRPKMYRLYQVDLTLYNVAVKYTYNPEKQIFLYA